MGIDKSRINKERSEQIVLGNIQPRLSVKIQLIDHQEQSKAIVVIQIPNSYLKPHMNVHDNKFYKRYQFQAPPMTEMEVNNAYRRRFAGYQEVENYVSELLEPKKFLSPQIIGQIIVIPTTLRRIIDTSKTEEFDWMSKLSFKPKYPYIRASPTPSANGIKRGVKDKDGHIWQRLEIHRNGCVHYMSYFGEKDEEKMVFVDQVFCLELLHTLQFASALYQRYNYFGDARIRCDLRWVKSSWIRRPHRFHPFIDYPCQVNEITVLREFPTNIIESKYKYITSGIMDEIYNCYGLWKCPLFDDKGNLKQFG